MTNRTDEDLKREFANGFLRDQSGRDDLDNLGRRAVYDLGRFDERRESTKLAPLNKLHEAWRERIRGLREDGYTNPQVFFEEMADELSEALRLCAESPVQPEAQPMVEPVEPLFGVERDLAGLHAAADAQLERDEQFMRELAQVVNRNGAERHSNTPDFVLGEFLFECMAAFDRATVAREKWYGCGSRAKPHTDEKVRAAIAFCREKFRNDGAAGESVHVLCDALEALDARILAAVKARDEFWQSTVDGARQLAERVQNENAVLRDKAACKFPPPGWHCIRVAGHTGPCAKIADTDPIVVTRGDSATCTVPPPGWRCTREAGHEGSCAAEPSNDEVMSAVELGRVHGAVDALEEYRRRMQREPACQRVSDESMQAAVFVLERLLGELRVLRGKTTRAADRAFQPPAEVSGAPSWVELNRLYWDAVRIINEQRAELDRAASGRATASTAREWIPCSERMPEENQSVTAWAPPDAAGDEPGKGAEE